MLPPMGDMLKLIWWAVIGLFRSRASLEADILTLRQSAQCAAKKLAEAACLQQSRSSGFCQALSDCAARCECLGDRGAGDCYSRVVYLWRAVDAEGEVLDGSRPGGTSGWRPQQERTEPSGHRPCRRGVKSPRRREPDVPGNLLRAQFGNVTTPNVVMLETAISASQ
jgi:hypothetical protein